MKTALRIMILLGIITFTSCSSDLDELVVNEPIETLDPGDDDDDCKSNCGGPS